MDAERWSRIETLFEVAVGLPAAERAEWLAARCGADPTLRRDVERLLAADAADSRGDVVDRMDRGTLLAARDPLIGTHLGAWRLVERIAAGGMGVVYRAARADGLFDQEVAIKLLRADLGSDRLAQRFAFERRTLAALRARNEIHSTGSYACWRPLSRPRSSLQLERVTGSEVLAPRTMR